MNVSTMMDKKSSDVLLKFIIILPWPSQFFKLTKNVTQNDHLTILNPASVSGIDHLRVLPPPLARIQVHPRVIHSTTNNTLAVPNNIHD